MAYFVSPKVVFGRGALDRLVDEVKSGDKVAIVTDKVMVELGTADKVSGILKGSGCEIMISDQAESDPSINLLGTIAEVISNFKPQIIIGLGGGSAIDSAKGAWLLYERPDLSGTYLPSTIYPGVKVGLHTKAKFISIPTTSGTGADVTWCVVMTDADIGRKIPVANHEIVPDVSILDPELTVGMPKELTAAVGMDVIGHAIDGYVARWQTDFSDGLCLQALKLAFEWLPKVYQDGSDLIAREKMQNAATIAGIGFGNSNTALAHCLAHPIGAVFGMHHGKTVSICLPYSVVFISTQPVSPNTPDPVEKLALAARFVGIDAKSSKEAVAKLIQRVVELAKSLGMPLTLKEAGITKEQMEENIDTLAYFAGLDPNKATTPVKAAGHFEELFWNMWEGKGLYLD